MVKKYSKNQKKENTDPLEKTDLLELEGVNITKAVKLVRDCPELADLKRRYFLWIFDIKEFVSDMDISEKSFFYEDDTVSETIDRSCGIDFYSDFCQDLLNNIFKETKKKLKYLRKVSKELRKKGEENPIKWFHLKNCCINFYGKSYKPRSKNQENFTMRLVANHQTRKNSRTILKPGRRISIKELSVLLKLSEKEIKQLKKQLNRAFRNKGFPLKIDSNDDGILLIYTI